MRLDKWKLILAFLIGLAIVVVVANVVVLVQTPEEPAAPCSTAAACPPPVAALAIGTPWTSKEYGYSFQYEDHLAIAEQDGRGVTLRLRLDTLTDGSRGGPAGSVSLGEVLVRAVPARDSTPNELLVERRDELAQRVLGLEEDAQSGTTILGPSIGHLNGVGGSYLGTIDSPQGPTQRAVVALIAATDGRITAVFSYVLAGTTLDANQTQTLREKADTILSTFRWPT